MNLTASVQIEWQVRAQPLAPGAVVARGSIARTLARRLLASDDEQLARWQGVAGPDVLIVLGEEATLPWVEGVTYLGRDERAPALWLPTTHEPCVPLPLLQRTLVQHAQGKTPLAVLRAPLAIAPLAAARPLSRAKLQAWLEAGA